MNDEKPFIEINIESTVESDVNQRSILEKIYNSNKKQRILNIEWIGTTEKPKLRFNFKNKAQIEALYQKDDSVLSRFIEFHQANKFPQTFQELESDKSDSEQIYLVLKYKTNNKLPIRQYYKRVEWYRHFFKINISTEETTDGFLFFYRRKQDFISSIIDKSNPEDFLIWLKKRGIKINSKVL